MAQFVVALLFLALAVANIKGDASDVEASVNGNQEARDKLLDDLFTNYKSYSYPDNTTVEFGVYLMNMDLDQVKDEMKTSVWLRYSWMDRRLSWDKEERGISLLRIPSSKVWIPDITLYNSANQDNRMACWDSNVIVYSTGKMLWIPPCNLNTFCNLTLSHTPFKEQICSLKFGSWTFDGPTLGLDLWKDEDFVNISVFQGSSKFKVTTNKAVKNEKKYDCCVEPYFDLTYTLGLTQIDYTVHNCDN